MNPNNRWPYLGLVAGHIFNLGDPKDLHEIDRIELDRTEAQLNEWIGDVAAGLDEATLTRLDTAVARIEAKQPKFDGWATPGANPTSAALDLARTAARRAERRLVGLRGTGRRLRPLLLQYLTRLSDLLWLMARQAES